MASYLTSTTLIESVKRRAAIPESQSTFETDDFLAFANEEISIGILPTMMQYHEEFLVYSETIPLVANKSSYPIPHRAVGSKIRTMFYQDTSGNLQEMARINPEDLPYYQSSSSANRHVEYYIQNNNVVLVRTVGDSVSGSLVVTYYLRPNQLVSSDKVSVIQSINRTTGDISVNRVPSTFNLVDTVDLLQTKGGHRTYVMDLSLTGLNATTKVVTLSPGNIPEDLVVGDVVALSGECFIPQIPDDLHSVLAQRVAARCLEAQGDREALNAANAKLTEMEMKMGNLIDNRSEGNPQKVVNLRSPLRGGNARRGGRRGV